MQAVANTLQEANN